MTESSPHPTQEKAGDPLQTARAQARKAAAPGRLRRYRQVVFRAYLLAALAGFIALALLVRTTAYFAIDVSITHLLQSEGSLWVSPLMQAISWPGYAPQAILVVALISLALALLGLYWEACMGAAAAGFIQGLNYLVKILIQRPRPSASLVEVFHDLHSFSFPSGHVMFYTAFFGFLFFLAFTLLRRSWRRSLLLVVLGLLVLLVGVSRIYLGEHWASDVLAAYLLGSLGLVAILEAYRWGKPRFFARQPVIPGQPNGSENNGYG